VYSVSDLKHVSPSTAVVLEFIEAADELRDVASSPSTHKDYSAAMKRYDAARDAMRDIERMVGTL